MQNISIKIRLIFLVLVSLVGLSLVATVGLWGAARLGDSIDDIEQRSMPAVTLMMGLRMAQLKSVLISREGSSWSSAAYDAMANKTDAVAEVNGLFASILERRDVADRLADRAYADYDALPKSQVERAQWQKVQAQLTSFQEIYGELRLVMTDLSTAHDWNAVQSGIARYKALEYPLGDFLERLEVEIQAQLQILHEHTDQVALEAGAAQSMALTFITVTSLLVGVFIAVFTFFIIQGITGSLSRLRNVITTLAQTNDFRVRVGVKGRDELAQTATAFNGLLEGVHGSLRAVLECAAQVSAAARETSDAADQVATASTRQSESASAMATAIEQVNASIGGVSTSAKDVLERSRQAGDAAGLGADIIVCSAGGMNQIDQVVVLASEAISRVHDQSGQITTITHVIRDVAEQTNLLALNAAIEAARAGEQGRGFAVVADEVRQLAERTARSTLEIRQMIGSMQASVADAASRMELIVGKVQDGKRLSSEASEHILRVQKHSKQVTQAITVISSALHEQSLASAGIAREVEIVAQMSVENNDVAAETSRISQDLQASSVALHEAVIRFKV
ncbi:methyl-accepting chemotaxis protein [Pseudomonas marginalis]|uniref:Methyl-accepting chemotaxis protein n=2 Tax=Pseudomonas marginalis TaxID=298 RepID=A0A9X9FWD3_PSEMA|nr:methyl-accepting chemotaxis protein [Pseudomonas marginalis]TWR56168.1 methyl-accepting chemotaxis protein [Pseudomonas marginalis]SEB61695.1 Tar ligand binding domain homologue [Pseudomonas marginalis]